MAEVSIGRKRSPETWPDENWICSASPHHTPMLTTRMLFAKTILVPDVYWSPYFRNGATMQAPKLLSIVLTSFVLSTMFCALSAQGQSPGAPALVNDDDLNTALTLGDLNAVKKLLAKGADPNAFAWPEGPPIWFTALQVGQKPIFYAMSERMRMPQAPTPAYRSAPTLWSLPLGEDTRMLSRCYSTRAWM